MLKAGDIMVAEILSVGTELLLGDIINTNQTFIARELKELGISVYFQGTVGDNIERLKAALEAASNRSDIVILTGGLGPTGDDLTKETVAEYLGLEMELDEGSWDNILTFFKKIGRTLTENNKKQAVFPIGSVILKNNRGTAPGCAIEKDDKTFIMLPGPPEEMEEMFLNEVIPLLRKKTHGYFYSKTLRVSGVGESRAADILKDLLDAQTNPTIAPYAKPNEVHLRVTASAESKEEAERLTIPTVKKIYEILGENIYGEDNTTLEQAVVTRLKDKKLTLGCAESCTGGLIASMLVNVPGASEVFYEGIVSYSNESKITRLGVLPETLKKHGAVSCETAAEMAEGIIKNLGLNVGVAVTGIAGPAHDNTKKETGLVYIGICVNGKTTVKEFHFPGDRERVRTQSAATALDLLRRILNGTEKD